MNRGTFHSLMGNYDLALFDYQSAVKINPNFPWQKPMAVLLFVMDRLADSAQTFEQAVKAWPYDAYAILWRYIVRAKNGEVTIAMREFSEGADKVAKDDWPGPIVQFFLGKITEAELFAAAENPARRKGPQLCEASFYAAEIKLLNGNSKDAIPLLKSAEKDCPSGFVERRAASAELKRLGQ